MRRMPIRIRRVDMWWRGVYALIGAGAFDSDPAIDGRWPAGLQEPVRLRSGALVRLDLQDWLQRRAYFSGLYYQTDLELLLGRLLRPGDVWVDVGANIGVVSLIAAMKIGPQGRGIAFEPNPLVYERLLDHLKLNGVNFISCHNVALGACPGNAVLSFSSVHTGTGSLVGPNPHASSIDVQVRCGDDFAVFGPGDRVVMKIDVEGYELEVLQGLSNALSHPETAILVEVIDEYLRRAGSSAAQVVDFLAAKGYEPYRFELQSHRWAKELVVRPAPIPLERDDSDLLFINRQSTDLRERLRSVAKP